MYCCQLIVCTCNCNAWPPGRQLTIPKRLLQDQTHRGSGSRPSTHHGWKAATSLQPQAASTQMPNQWYQLVGVVCNIIAASHTTTLSVPYRLGPSTGILKSISGIFKISAGLPSGFAARTILTTQQVLVQGAWAVLPWQPGGGGMAARDAPSHGASICTQASVKAGMCALKHRYCWCSGNSAGTHLNCVDTAASCAGIHAM